YQVESFAFSDQTITLEQLHKDGLTLQGTAGNDTINAWDGRSFVYAGDGNDIVNTSDKDDLLDGGTGNDTLNAGGGNDTLIGGTGNDILNGGTGSDRYIFSKGHGQDTIYDYGSSSIKDIDQVQFTDVASTDVKFRKEGSDLVLFGYSGDDSL
ncbi:calcium-binding protein, partial [Bacillus cereus]|uniref:calcium-binding protein n=1 Tax=Bacillus cereus TaxID=1396 RepID=UPI0034D798B9